MQPSRQALCWFAVVVLSIALIAVWAAGLPLALRFAVAALLLLAVAATIYEHKRG